MSSPNGLICFTNCLLPLEDGGLVEKDLWIDEHRGVILDAQNTFFRRNERPAQTIDLGGNILSPGFLDIQINGAYGFDFSIYEGDDQVYRDGLRHVAQKIIESGVTSLVPTIVTQERSLYPKLLSLLRPYSPPSSANILGWHAEGPYLQFAKRGAHAPPFLINAPEGYKSVEKLYGAENLADAEDWLMNQGVLNEVGVRIITAAPEVEGVMESISELTKRGIIFSIGHSIATIDLATTAVQNGANLITHLFNAMPQLHHRDPSIIGLLGASPHLFPQDTPSYKRSAFSGSALKKAIGTLKPAQYMPHKSEAFDDLETPSLTPVSLNGAVSPPQTASRGELHLDKGQVADLSFERPFYEMIVDGIHSHPNSVRLAYSSHPEGCILITDAMKILDPNLHDGVHEWRDGKRFVKEGDKLYLEGTNTLAGSVVTLDKCVRNFSRFTGCSLGEAIKCATYNPAKCLRIENRKGTLRSGADADFVILDRKGNVLNTWVKGKQVWSKGL